MENLYNQARNWLLLRYKHVRYGRALNIRGRLLIQGKGEIRLGDHVTIYSHYAVNLIGGGRTVFQVMRGAFVGTESDILKGITVGRHSVEGAGSVVTKDVPDGGIWAGNPARRIRRLENLERQG